MKLRFDVDQAACLRAGIDCPKSIVTVEINPSELAQKQRDLLADRLEGIDVCQLWNDDTGTHKAYKVGTEVEEQLRKDRKPMRIIANAPTFEGLMKAVQENEAEVTQRRSRHRSVALATSEAGFDTRTEAKLAARKLRTRE